MGVRELTGAVAQYVRGKAPSHCGSATIVRAFNIPEDTTTSILESLGFMNGGKPTRAAVDAGLVDRWRDKALWRVDAVLEKLWEGVPAVERVVLNQEVPVVGEGRFVNTTTIGTYFNVSGVVVGRWLKEAGVRDPDTGVPTREAVRSKLAQVSTVETGAGRKDFVVWDLQRVLVLLAGEGRVFDYDYGKTLVGRGRNSDVVTMTVEEKARRVAADVEAAVGAGEPVGPVLRNVPGRVLPLVERCLRYPEGSLSDPAFVNNLC